MSEFTEDQLDGKPQRLKSFLMGFLAFKDAFELFDRTGEGKIAWKDCASLARCFGYNPTNAFVLNLLITGNADEEPELPPTKQELEENFVTLDEFLPHLWIVSQAPDPGSYEDFFEGLKVFDKHGDQGCKFASDFRLKRKATRSEAKFSLSLRFRLGFLKVFRFRFAFAQGF